MELVCPPLAQSFALHQRYEVRCNLGERQAAYTQNTIRGEGSEAPSALHATLELITLLAGLSGKQFIGWPQTLYEATIQSLVSMDSWRAFRVRSLMHFFWLLGCCCRLLADSEPQIHMLCQQYNWLDGIVCWVCQRTLPSNQWAASGNGFEVEFIMHFQGLLIVSFKECQSRCLC